MKQQLTLLRKSDSGVAALEFALILPMMIIILFAIVEIGRLILMDQKVNTAAFDVADLVTQHEEISNTLLLKYANTVHQITKPLSFTGTVIISSVASVDVSADAEEAVSSVSADASASVDADADATAVIPPWREKIGCKNGCVVWQRKFLGTANSNIGAAGERATLPNEYRLRRTQNVIVVEVVAQYAPLLALSGSIISAFQPKTLRAIALVKPRQDNLLNNPA